MSGLIIFIIISVIVACLILFALRELNTNYVGWAVVLLMIVSVFSGRWHRHFLPRWYQVRFESVADKATSANSHLRTQIREYNHHDNAHSGIALFKTYYRSSFVLGQAQDDSIQSTRRMIRFPIKRTIDPKGDFKERQRIGKRQIKVFDSHKYVGQGYKTDNILTEK